MNSYVRGSGFFYYFYKSSKLSYTNLPLPLALMPPTNDKDLYNDIRQLRNVALRTQWSQNNFIICKIFFCTKSWEYSVDRKTHNLPTYALFYLCLFLLKFAVPQENLPSFHSWRHNRIHVAVKYTIKKQREQTVVTCISNILGSSKRLRNREKPIAWERKSIMRFYKPIWGQSTIPHSLL